MRIGIGYDVHRLTRGRPLILGGVSIPSAWGLDGHSDGDVLMHAIGDALLGALALGDLGEHFPDTDPSYRDMSSAKLLEAIVSMMHERAYRLHNLDTVVIAQRPRVALYIPAMRQNLANLLLTDLVSISVKAKTAEHLGALGRGEGIAAYAVCVITPHER
jgi:2-C-methyl-D-erythritol 2,4-cyclodiphosphate synthase